MKKLFVIGMTAAMALSVYAVQPPPPPHGGPGVKHTPAPAQHHSTKPLTAAQLNRAVPLSQVKHAAICNNCKGKGKIAAWYKFGLGSRECPACNGTGRLMAVPAPVPPKAPSVKAPVHQVPPHASKQPAQLVPPPLPKAPVNPHQPVPPNHPPVPHR